MNEVSTLRGPVPASQLGSTLMHEHLFILAPEMRVNYPNRFNEEEEHAQAVQRLKAAHAAGVRTIVDPTVLGLGRDLRRMKAVADEVDVNILAATGCYTFDKPPSFAAHRGPSYTMFPEPTEFLVDLFLQDVEEGIAGTGIKAAFLKCAIDAEGLTPGVERILRAVAAVHRRTGVPITVHTDPQRQTGLTVQAVFAQEGVDLTRVVLGHSGDSVDLDYLMKVMDAGSIIGMDRFGVNALLTFEQRLGTVAELCRRGYADRMVLSHDASCVTDWFPAGYETAHPDWNLTYVHTEVVPELIRRGVTQEQIASMLVDAPAKYFAAGPRVHS